VNDAAASLAPPEAKPKELEEQHEPEQAVEEPAIGYATTTLGLDDDWTKSVAAFEADSAAVVPRGSQKGVTPAGTPNSSVLQSQ